MVQEQIFVVLQEIENTLETFSGQSNVEIGLLNEASLKLNQVRGILQLIELIGAELLGRALSEHLEFIISYINDNKITAPSDPNLYEYLVELGVALNGLKYYLENAANQKQEIPEIIIPIINRLKKLDKKPLIHESIFFNVNLTKPHPHIPAKVISGETRLNLIKKCLQAYQVGLQGVIKNEEYQKNITLMFQSVVHLENIYSEMPCGKLLWIAAASLEAFHDNALGMRDERAEVYKNLLQELPKILKDPKHETTPVLLKDLLYFVALANSNNKRVAAVKSWFNLAQLPYDDKFLEEECKKISKPTQSIAESISTILEEEVNGIKDSLDKLERGELSTDDLLSLSMSIERLSQTFSMSDMKNAGDALLQQLPNVKKWMSGDEPDTAELISFADCVLYIDNVINDAKTGKTSASGHDSAAQESSFKDSQLEEGRMSLIHSSHDNLVHVKQCISLYLEGEGDKTQLEPVTSLISQVVASLKMLGQEDASNVIKNTLVFIKRYMIESNVIPNLRVMNFLADVLTYIEYFLEVKKSEQLQSKQTLVAKANESLKNLGV
jgi:hypothetical protein